MNKIIYRALLIILKRITTHGQTFNESKIINDLEILSKE